MTYLQTSTVINLANGIFGYKGWSSSVTELWENYSDHVNGRWSICYSAKVKVELQNGTFHEDVGTGSGLSANRADALDQAQKTACSDALKRAIRMFGDGLGNNLVSGGQNPVVVAPDESGGDVRELTELLKSCFSAQGISAPQSTSVAESVAASANTPTRLAQTATPTKLQPRGQQGQQVLQNQ